MNKGIIELFSRKSKEEVLSSIMVDFFTKERMEVTLEQMGNTSFTIRPRIQERNKKPNILEREVSKDIIEEVEEKYAKEIADNKIILHSSKVEKHSIIDGKKEIENTVATSIEFKKEMHNVYCIYREADLRANQELIEGCLLASDINFNYEVIGSDETGKGEVFKPMAVVATYIKDVEQLRECIGLGIEDSKKLTDKKSKIIGSTITGIKNWEEIQEKVKNREVISNEFFAARIITNKEYNEVCGNKNGNSKGVEAALLKEAHIQVLKELSAKHPEAIIVVDDFMDTNNKDYDKKAVGAEFKANLQADTYLTTKGDSKIMAIALASNISYYLSDLVFECAKKRFEELTKKSKLPKGSPKAADLVDVLKGIERKDLEEFVDEYAKADFGNLVEAMDNIKE